MSLKLNIGAGSTVIDGYTPVDRKFGQEAFPLAFPDNSAETIRASHVLEHFGWAEVDKVLEDWVRVLKPGGEIYISVPDFAKAVMMGQDGTDPKWPYYIMGGQTDENDFHKVIFTDADLRARMERVGLATIEPWHSSNTDTAAHPVSLNLKGRKPTVAAIDLREVWAKTRPVFNMPRLGFADNFFTAARVFIPRGILFDKHTGVYWQECQERVMLDALIEGFEYIVTLDYDTVFDGETFDDLCRLMVEHPEADAIATLQMKRENDTPFVWDVDRDNLPIFDFHLTGDLTRIKHAHFGLTMFRASALKDIPHPWFHSQPNIHGNWGDGRMDADIFFWEKFAAFDKKLFLAHKLSIGHAQLVFTWPKRGGGVHHQFTSDYFQNGKPKEFLW